MIFLICAITVLIIGIKTTNNNTQEIAEINSNSEEILAATSVGTNVVAEFNASAGEVTITSTQGIGTLNNASLRNFWNTCGIENIITITFTNEVYAPAESYGLFVGAETKNSLPLSSLKDINNLRYLNTSKATRTHGMFMGCSSLTSLDVSNFDTSNVTGMDEMFKNCKELTTLDVSNFDTSKVTIMSGMFYGCSSLTTIDVTNFNTSNVIYMNQMFFVASPKTLNMSNWDMSKVVDVRMFFMVIRL